MADELKKQKLINAIKTAPDDLALSEYLLGVSRALNPTRFESKTITLHESIQELLKEKECPFSIPLKTAPLDELSKFFSLTTGLHIIGAMSGHGKTFWAMEWAKEAAKQGMPVLMLSLEMTHQDLSARTLSQMIDFSLMKILKRDFSDSQRHVISDLLEEPTYGYLKNIHVDTFGDYDWVKIYPRLWDRMIQLKPKLIIVDYIQMISNSEEEDRMSKVLSDIARELKLFADQNQAASLVLSQFNREALKEIRMNKIPEGDVVPLSHSYIKESGGIVEAADSVQLVCIPKRLQNCPAHLANSFQVTVSKSRRLGLLGTKLFPFDVETMRFHRPS